MFYLASIFRMFICAASLVWVTMISSIVAEQKPKTIFMVHWQNSGRTILGETFIKYLREKHLNVQFIERQAKQNKSELKKIIAEIKQVRPDLIYIYSTVAVLEMAGAYDAVDPAKHITDIPIIAVAHSEPIATKIVKEIGVPTGRNVTGVGHYVPIERSLGVMQSFASGIHKIVVLSTPEKNAVTAGKKLKDLANMQNIQVVHVLFDVKGDKIVDGGIETTVLNVLAEKPDMIFLPSDGIVQGNIQQIVEEFIKHKSIHAAPLYTTLEDMVREPGTCVFGYFTSFAMMGVMAGVKAEEILFKSKNVATVPYEIGTRNSLAIREDTMNALGTTPMIGMLESAEIYRKVASNG